MKKDLLDTQQHYGNAAQLYHTTMHSHRLYEFVFLDSNGDVLFYAHVGKDPDMHDAVRIHALIKELSKARGGNLFNRSFGGTPDRPVDFGNPMNVSAVRFRFYPDSVFKDSAFHIDASSLALQMLDEHEGTCLIEIPVGGKEEQVIIDRLPSSDEKVPDRCTRRLLYLALVLKQRAELSQLLYTVESCWDTSTEKTQKHFGEFLN